MITAFVDGSCLGNPGPGGWGVVLKSGAETKEFGGGDKATTNSRMELMAAIKALEAVVEGTSIAVHTDSQYVKNGITEWIKQWKVNGWRTAKRKPVRNADLWRRLDELAAKRDVAWHWVKAHDGHPDNERADELAYLMARAA